MCVTETDSSLDGITPNWKSFSGEEMMGAAGLVTFSVRGKDTCELYHSVIGQ